MKNPSLSVEVVKYRKGDPIPDLSHHFEEINRVFGDKLDYSHLFFNIEKQVENGTKDEFSLFYYTLEVDEEEITGE